MWPANYVYAEFLKFWFLIIPAIIIEAFIIKVFFRYPLKKSFWISITGNVIFGFLGTFMLMWGMTLWHFFADDLLPQRTFNIVNWVATYIIMCLGSVLLETFAIKLIFKESFKKLFLPLFTGNLLIFIFIAYSMGMNTEKHQNEQRRSEKISYIPLKNIFTLLDSTHLTITGAFTTVFYDIDNNILNENFPLEVRFTKENFKEFSCRFRLTDEESKLGLENRKNIIPLNQLTDTIRIILEQKNPEPDKAWSSPVIIDTIVFFKHRNVSW